MEKQFFSSKVGAEKTMSIYWFVILFIVAAAVVYMVILFYGKPYDARQIETGFLTDKIASCFSQNGLIRDDWQQIDNANLFDKCSLTFRTEDSYGWKNDQYYLNISVYNFTSGKQLLSIMQGNIDLTSFCAVNSQNSPVCLDRSFYVIDKNNLQYKIEVFSIVRKTEKNV